MIINGIVLTRNVDKRLRILKELDFVHFDKISEYEKMPDIIPLDNEILFFDDGIEAIVDKLLLENNNDQYCCKIVDEKRRRIIEYSFEGRDYTPINVSKNISD